MSGILETSAANYEEERTRSKDKMQHSTIQDAGCVPVFSADVQQKVLIKQEAPELRRPGVDQQDPHTPNIKQEEDPWSSLEREQLCVNKDTVITGESLLSTFTNVQIVR